jgi:serpin B
MKMNALLLAALVGATACGSNSPNGSAPPDGAEEIRSTNARLSVASVPTGHVDILARSQAAFGFDLYGEAPKDGNFIYSPISLSVALGMTYAGARGTTRDEMRAVFGADLTDEQFHAAFNALDQALESRGENASDVSGSPFALNVVNQIWGQIGETFEAPFLNTLAENYGAGLFALDFAANADPSRITINDWVAAQTNDKIVDLLQPGTITADTRLVLTNAIYFNASWNEPFAPSRTADADFTRLDSSTVSVPFMNHSFETMCGGTSGVQLVELPYDGGEVSMVVAVPDDFASFEASLSTDLVDLASSMTSCLVTLSLPKFEARASFSAKDALESLGMPTAFSGDADFTGIRASGGLAISDVVHQAFIRVDEEGTEAAAATAVIIRETSAPTPVVLSANKPFFFFIRDNATNAVLFAGRVVDPS